MIVTCPNCTTKFRVRDDSVPEEGAQLKCATCSTVFMAYAPKKSDEDIKTIVERLKTSKEAAVERAKALEAELTALRTRFSNFESELQKLRTQNLQLTQETDDLRRGREAVERRFHDELSRLKDELAAAKTHSLASSSLQAQLEASQKEVEVYKAQAQQAGQLKDDIVRLQADLLKAKATAALGSNEDVRKLQAALDVAERTTGKLTVDLESTRQELEALKRDGGKGDGKDAEQYRAEAERLRKQLAMVVDSGREFVDPADLLAAVGPLVWGLDNAIEYIEPFAGTEPLLQGHFRQLQLLSGVIHRLQKSADDDIA